MVNSLIPKGAEIQKEPGIYSLSMHLLSQIVNWKIVNYRVTIVVPIIGTTPKITCSIYHFAGEIEMECFVTDKTSEDLDIQSSTALQILFFIAKFEALYCWTSVEGWAHTHFVDSLDIQAPAKTIKLQ